MARQFIYEKKLLGNEMNAEELYKATVRISLSLLTLALIATGLYLGRTILVPFFLAVLLAMVLNPLVGFLTSHKFNRVIAILLCIILAVSFILAIMYFFSVQISGFLDDMPTLKERLRELATAGKEWVRENFKIGIREQNRYLDKTTENMTNGSQGLFQQTFLTLTELVSYLIFLPVYTFLIIYHKDLILRFLTDIFKKSEEDNVVETLYEAQFMAQRYIVGILIQTTVVFALNCAGFLLLGIKYPVFLALMAAILNIVPYIGMLIANILCALITLVSADPSFNVLWVVGVLAFVQIVDNNIIMPFIVGTQIKINALALILSVLVGGALCGIPGMFLAVPGLAMVKVVFERVNHLKPWAILLGDDTSTNLEHRNPLKSVFTRARKRVDEKHRKKDD
jgi:predicted PurR-regulated permease PerM